MNIKKILFLAIAMLLLVATAAESKIYLVAVGVSDYPGNKMDLRLPDKDAQTIAWLYAKNDKVKYALLLNSDATRKRVKAAMKKVFGEARENDIVVFFFSGHGYQGGFCAYDGIMDYSVIRNGMSASKCKNKMIFADACFSGAMRQKENSSSQNGNNHKNSNVMLFLSCRSNEKSIETPKMTNGFFTYALQHGLRGGADTNKDRIITAKELFDYVSAKVKKESNNRQHPVMWGKFSNNMPVMKW